MLAFFFARDRFSDSNRHRPSSTQLETCPLADLAKAKRSERAAAPLIENALHGTGILLRRRWVRMLDPRFGPPPVCGHAEGQYGGSQRPCGPGRKAVGRSDSPSRF